MARFFCARSFEFAEVRLDGSVYLCCNGWVDGPVGNVLQASLLDIWNGPKAQQFRSSIWDGSFSSCGKCPYLPRAPAGPVILRTGPIKARHREWVKHSSTFIPKIRVLNLAYDRSCNLTCPSCRHEVHIWTGRALKYMKFIQDRVLADDVLSKVRRLYLSGSGDPFASKTLRQFLRELEPSRYPDLGIRLQTNALLFDEKAWEDLGPSRALVYSVSISIDAATPNTYAMNRRGGDWQTLIERLEFIASIRRAGAIRFVEFYFVVQANNFREMPAFVEFAKCHGADAVSFMPLMNWGTYSREEYAQRAIQDHEHPEHEEYLRLTREIPMKIKFAART